MARSHPFPCMTEPGASRDGGNRFPLGTDEKRRLGGDLVQEHLKVKLGKMQDHVFLLPGEPLARPLLFSV